MNNINETKEYLKKMESLKLSEESRARMSKDLLEYARFHGVRVGDGDRSIEQVQSSTSFITKILNLNKKSMIAAIITLMLVAGGGSSYAAEKAVPGDLLYGMKVEVNENIKGAFAFSDEAEAKLQMRLAEERLKEAEELASRGELTAETSAVISSRLKTHFEEAEKNTAELEANGNYESSAIVRSSLEGSLRAYADVLADLNTKVDGNNGDSLITDIRLYADTATKAQTKATSTIETTVDVKATVEATIERADNLILKVQTKAENAKEKISAEAQVLVEAKVAEAVGAQAKAKASLEAGAYQEAYAHTQTAVRLASEAETMIDSMLRIEVNTDLKVDSAIDAVLDINTKKPKTEVDSNTGATTSTESSVSNEGNGSSTDIEVNANTDVQIDTGVVDTNIRSDSSVRSGLSL